ncbi:MAG: hypothetical protein ACRDHX_03235 [Chloroflexota bacterium]
MAKRELGVEYFIRALSTGERTASQRLKPLLAPDVEYDTNTQPGALPIGRELVKGSNQVLERVSGLWPATPGYSRLGWSEPLSQDGGLRVITSGAVTVDFSFDRDDQISRVFVDGGYGSGKTGPTAPAGQVVDIPLAVKGLVNNALANQTPIMVTYVDPSGAPHSSLRGSTSVINPTQFAIWVRHGDGGLPRSVAHNPHVALFYSDRRANTVINALGRAHIAEDAETRRKVFEQAPEVEQTHDPERHGVALVIEVIRLQANTGGRGTYTLARE